MDARAKASPAAPLPDALRSLTVLAMQRVLGASSATGADGRGREPARAVLFRGASVVISDLEGEHLASPVASWIARHDLPHTAPHVTLLFTRAGALTIAGGMQVRATLADPARVVLLGRRDALGATSVTAGTYSGTVITIALPPADARATLPASDAVTVSLALLLRLQRLRHALLCASEPGVGTALDVAVEREVLAILDLALAARAAERVWRPRGTRSAQHRALADRACALMAAAPDAPHRLADIARALAVSPFHLARTFRAHVGIPMHQYLLRVRLARALEEIAGGERSLSALALRLGFASHSHFTATFRRMFGMSPARFREVVSSPWMHASDAATQMETRQTA